MGLNVLRREAILEKMAVRLPDIPPIIDPNRGMATSAKLRQDALAPGGMTIASPANMFHGFSPSKAQSGYMSQIPSGGELRGKKLVQNIAPALPQGAGFGANQLYNTSPGVGVVSKTPLM